MTVSKTDVCNLALSYLNQDFITDFESGTTKTDRVCRLWYDHARKFALRSASWNFASKRAKLPKSTTVPVFDYEAAYKLPSDFVRLTIQGSDLEGRDYVIEDGYLLVNGYSENSIGIKYVYNLEIVAKMDPLFIDYFAACLAKRICKPITGSTQEASYLSQLESNCKAVAVGVDGQERPPKRIEKSKLLRARSVYSSDRADIVGTD